MNSAVLRRVDVKKEGYYKWLFVVVNCSNLHRSVENKTEEWFQVAGKVLNCAL